MDSDENNELNRREFLAWAAAAAAALAALPGINPAMAGERALRRLSSSRAYASSGSGSSFGTTTIIDPGTPLVVPDPPPPIINTHTVYIDDTPVASYTNAAYTPAASGTTPAQQAYTQPMYLRANYAVPQQNMPANNTAPQQAAPAYYTQAPAPAPAPVFQAPRQTAQAPAPASQGAKLRAVSRRSWASVAPNPQKMRAMNGVSRLTIHHEGSAKPNNDTTPQQVSATLRLIQSQHHKRMGAGDIGYHFIIDRGGTIWQGRDWRYQGAHTSGANSNNIGVMLLGNFEIQKPTSPQLASLHNLVVTLSRMFGLNLRSDIYGHSDFCNTQCPGKNLKPAVQAFRRMY